MEDSVLVLGLDGLDFDLIKEFGLEAVRQKEFGQVDNHTGVHLIETNELWTSFATGELYEAHGIIGANKYDSAAVNYLERNLQDYYWGMKTNGIRSKIYRILGVEPVSYIPEDVRCDTLADLVPDTETYFYPVIDEVRFQGLWKLLHSGLPAKKLPALFKKRFSHKKRVLKDAVSSQEIPSLTLAHIHYVDAMQHLFGDKKTLIDRSELEATYMAIDDFVDDLLGVAKQDHIILASDHGLPKGPHHNKNAFYSVNTEVGLDFPHITDFFKIIREWVGSEGQDGKQEERQDAPDDADIKRRMEELGYI